MENAKVIPRGFGAALVLVLLAAAAGGAGQWWADGASQTLQLAHLGELCAEAWEAAVVEEVLFRGVFLWACLAWARHWNESHLRPMQRADGSGHARVVSHPARFAVVVSSFVFGVMHLLPAGPLVAPGADIGVVAVQGLLKVAQATLFGVVMARLVVRSPFDSCPLPRRALALVAPVIVHGLFDLLFLGPLLLTGDGLPSTYLTGNAADFLPLVVTTVLLAWALKSC